MTAPEMRKIAEEALAARRFEREAWLYSCDVMEPAEWDARDPGQPPCALDKDRTENPDRFEWCESCTRWRAARKRRSLAARRLRYHLDKILDAEKAEFPATIAGKEHADV